ncbi:rhodanese-like domain-containing protein [Nannocystis pusilla]|uniref:rhodanese-like domain-containing protein n=1 Tax=Nannocystis pusilla TaxID=889268 RepID=UPI003B7A1151
MLKRTDPKAVTSEALLTMPIHERLVKLNWLGQLWTAPDGTPLLPVEFVGRQGRTVQLVDVREAEELTGPLGYVPGSVWLPLARIHEAASRWAAGTPVVLVSRNGGPRAAQAAQALECLGMEFVAVMDGGISAWRKFGFATMRDEAIFRQAEVPAPAPVEIETAPGPLSQAQIEAHIGDAQRVRWVKMAALMLHSKTSCVDGRDDHAVVGTPGGDAGEFLLALAAVERVTGQPVPLERIAALLEGYVETFGHFYIHSDTTAGNNLIAAMRADPALSDRLPPTSSGPKEWRAFLNSPPEALRPLVLEHMITPGNLGCGHLRLMLQHPERYLIRRPLVEAFLRALFSMRWNGMVELDLVILGGGHEEGAVVNVRLEQGVWAFTRVPLISPACGTAGVQIFVNHPQVADFMREQVARYFTTHPELLPLGEAEYGILRKDIRRLAEIQQAATLSVLAKGLPVFDVVFRNAREFTVKAAGVVG